MSEPIDVTQDSSPSEPSSSPAVTTGPADATGPSDGQRAAAEVLPRPMVPVSLLTAHPGNVRRDLDLSPEFLASIQENGILVPLRITRDADGALRVIDGHRRLAAAVETGLAEVPADLAGERAGDEPGQFLDMWNAHRHRNPLTPLEEADALFAAREAGATKTRIRRSTGLKPQEVNAALAAARLSDGTRAAVQASPYELTLEDLAVLAEFEDDQQAVAALLEAARWGAALEHQAERLRQQRAEKAGHERLRRQLEEAGVSITESLPPGGQLLSILRHDGQELTPDSHADCPGRGAFFRSYDLTAPVFYCADPATYGHTLPNGDAITASPVAGGTPAPAGSPGPEPGPADESRRLVIQGNKAWKAAAAVRKRWLTTKLFPRRSAPREVAQFVARELLTMPDPLRAGLATAHIRVLFAELTGQPAGQWVEACGTATAARLPLLMLAPIATAYEQAMTEGEGRNTWRLDRYSPCPRHDAGRYLTFLASLGYQLSGIEQAVAAGEPWHGDDQDTGPVLGDSEPSDAAGDPAGEASMDAGAGEGCGAGDDDGTGIDQAAA
jgi:ParB/RepB/Spo0J family partition protein